MNIQPYIGLEVAYGRSLNARWLMPIELVLLCLIFQFLSSFTLSISVQESIEPMLASTLCIQAALFAFGAYKRVCFNNMPQLYLTLLCSYLLGSILCTSTLGLLLENGNQPRFSFAYLLVSIIILTTLRSIVCGVLTEKDIRDRLK